MLWGARIPVISESNKEIRSQSGLILLATRIILRLHSNRMPSFDVRLEGRQMPESERDCYEGEKPEKSVGFTPTDVVADYHFLQ